MCIGYKFDGSDCRRVVREAGWLIEAAIGCWLKGPLCLLSTR